MHLTLAKHGTENNIHRDMNILRNKQYWYKNKITGERELSAVGILEWRVFDLRFHEEILDQVLEDINEKGDFRVKDGLDNYKDNGIFCTILKHLIALILMPIGGFHVRGRKRHSDGCNTIILFGKKDFHLTKGGVEHK